MNGHIFNSSIICVDDEPTILAAYRNVLKKQSNESHEQARSLISQRRQRMGKSASEPDTAPEGRSYNLFTASSGEEAIKIVKKEMASGRQIAAGFFDMSMPGGIDGTETIGSILQLDDQMLCAIVTAYTDRSTDQLAKLFRRQDDWLYFNKPFTTGELQQTAYHLVTAWNQRRRIEALISNLEMTQKGLLHIINSVSDINKVPPLMMEQLLNGVLKHFLELLGAKDGFIILLSQKSAEYKLGVGTFGKITDFTGPELQLQWALVEKSVHNKKSEIKENLAASPLMIGNTVAGVIFVQKDEPIVQSPELLDIYAIQSINMIQQSKLYEELDRSNLELSQKNQEMVDVIGKLTKAEKLKAHFEKLSYIDGLIGIPNRHYLENRFREELNWAHRHKMPMACLMIDIDHFKKINDTYGHTAGDYVLKEMGKIFLENKREYEMIGRYGGEEFVMLLRQIEPGSALAVSERLRSIVAKYPFCFDKNKFSVTVSIGIAALAPTPEDTVESVYKKADEALYMAKNNGRNKCVLI